MPIKGFGTIINPVRESWAVYRPVHLEPLKSAQNKTTIKIKKKKNMKKRIQVAH